MIGAIIGIRTGKSFASLGTLSADHIKIKKITTQA
jgi:hypothetical protein